MCRYSPGASSYALTVGGTRQNDDLYLRLFDGTNYGKCVDIFAPGQEILSAGISHGDAAETLSGTSQATPLVSGVAAVYWNIKRNATALQIKDMITSTCTRNKLRIRETVPSDSVDDTPNCLLFVNNRLISVHEGNLPYFVFHSVPLSEVEPYIIDMEENFYALAYISSYSVDSSVYYSLIFKYKVDVEFVTVMFTKLKQLKQTVASYEADGYQLTLIYNMMSSINHIAVLEKTNRIYSHEYRLTAKKHYSIYQTKSSQNDSLLSTTVALTSKSGVRITSIYVQDNMTTHHLLNVSNSKLLRKLNKKYKQGFYLTHLSTIPTDPPSYAAVFHKMTKPSTSYIMSKELELYEVEEFVQTQINEGFTPLVVAGLDTANGLKFVVSFEQ